MARAIKRAGPQACDSCGREFTVTPLPDDSGRYDWECPHCGFDNRVAGEWGRHGLRIAAAKSAEQAKLKAKARKD